MANTLPTRTLLPTLLLALGLVAFGLPAASAAPTQLGTDPEGDDAKALTAFADPAVGQVGEVVPCPTADDCSNIDDILALEVSTGTDEVTFKMLVKESPDASELLQGQYCWVAAFQVQGDDEEFLGMGCIEYTNGEGKAIADDSGRGTEVASSMEWVTGEAALLIHVPFETIGAGVGSTLVDIYGLTYISSSLLVDDAAPDAKSDRAAEESFGSFVIGSDLAPAPAAPADDTNETATDDDASASATTTSSSATRTQTTPHAPVSDDVAAGADALAGNDTADDDGSKGAPGAPLPLLLGAIVATVLAARRRR